MNFLPGQVAADGAHVEVDGGPSLPMPPDLRSAAPDRRVLIGIRPEHIGTETGGNGETAHLNLKVDLAEALGADTLVHGLVGSGAAITARTAGHRRFSPGDTVPLDVASKDLHVFDAETGRRLTNAA